MLQRHLGRSRARFLGVYHVHKRLQYEQVVAIADFKEHGLKRLFVGEDFERFFDEFALVALAGNVAERRGPSVHRRFCDFFVRVGHEGHQIEHCGLTEPPERIDEFGADFGVCGYCRFFGQLEQVLEVFGIGGLVNSEEEVFFVLREVIACEDGIARADARGARLPALGVRFFTLRVCAGCGAAQSGVGFLDCRRALRAVGRNRLRLRAIL